MKRVLGMMMVVGLAASAAAQAPVGLSTNTVKDSVMVVQPAVAPTCTLPADAPKPAWKLRPDLSLDVYTSAVYDLGGGAWLAGYSKDLLHLDRGERTVLYLAASHLFDTSHEGKGALGMALGFNTGALGEKLDDLANRLFPSSKGTLGVVGDLANYLSVEFAGGYRFMGRAPEQAPWVYAVGGRVKVPLGSIGR